MDLGRGVGDVCTVSMGLIKALRKGLGSHLRFAAGHFKHFLIGAS